MKNLEDRFKFRVWSLKNSKWTHADLMIRSDGSVFYQIDMLDSDRFDVVDKEDLQQFVFMQCTGLKDKNGKLIYEGDIISYVQTKAKGLCVVNTGSTWDDECNVQFSNKVWYNRTSFLLGSFDLESISIDEQNRLLYREVKSSSMTGYNINRYENFEIIGNIYQNPELINL